LNENVRTDVKETVMKNAILAWYAYSESGAASRAARAFARGRLREWAEGLEPEQVGPDADALLAQLDDPERVLELFADARRLDAEVTPQGWRRLWTRYSLEGLIDLARRGGDWPQSANDEDIAEALVEESLEKGYDPVSGLVCTGEVT
jgi:hypothetical protein